MQEKTATLSRRNRGYGDDELSGNLIAHAISKGTGGGLGGRDGQDDYVIAAPLTSGSHPGSNAPGRHKEDDENLVVIDGQNASAKRDDKTGTIQAEGQAKQNTGYAVAVQESKRDGVAEYGTAGSLRANAPGHQPGGSLLRQQMIVRRLTPTTCERLMGMEDGHSCTCGVNPACPDRRIPPWIDPSKVRLGGCGHSSCGCKCPDGPRYRMLGNSVAVPVIRWIADRLSEALRG